jgi:hypothetical protein
MNWRRTVSEFIIIMFGVLAALAADSAMDGYRERLATRDALDALRADIWADLNELEYYFVPQLQRQEEGRERLEQLLKDSTPIEDILEYVNDVRLISSYHTFNPNRVGLEDLISTGGLSLIRNRELRNALLGYRRELDNIQEFDFLHRGYFLGVRGEFGPNLIGGLALPRSLDAEIGLIDETVARTEAIDSIDLETIRSSDDLRRLLVMTAEAQRIKQQRYLAARDKAKVLVALLDESLSNN